MNMQTTMVLLEDVRGGTPLCFVLVEGVEHDAVMQEVWDVIDIVLSGEQFHKLSVRDAGGAVLTAYAKMPGINGFFESSPMIMEVDDPEIADQLREPLDARAVSRFREGFDYKN